MAEPTFATAEIALDQNKTKKEVQTNSDNDFQLILDNARALIYSGMGTYTDASYAGWSDNYVENQSPDGSYSVFKYTGSAVAYEHLERMRKMAICYTRPTNKYYKNESFYNAIVKGLEYWYSVNPRHSNWYYNHIQYPTRIAETMALMRYGSKKIPIDLEEKMIYLLETRGGDPKNQEYSNRTQIARHWILRACLKQDREVLDYAFELSFDPLKLSPSGIQFDYSFFAHGAQLYIGAYGQETIEGVIEAEILGKNTKYQMDSEQLKVLSNFVRETYLPTIRGRYHLFNVFGRSIAVPNRSDQRAFINSLNFLKVKDPTYAITYTDAIARINLSKPASYTLENKYTHYYRADYTLHSKPSYTFDVRSVSTRTVRSEHGNGQNLLGYFLGDGGTSITVTGNEYYNIFPTWNWTMIPGTTVRNGKIPRLTAWGTNYGSTSFVGGVSDTTRGVSVYDMDSNNTRGKKAWFFFDDEVVCLGAGINSTGAGEVNTTLNQCLLQGDVSTFSQDGVLTNYINNSVETNANNLKWVLHGKVGYVIPDGGNSDIGLTSLPRTGKWSDISSGESANMVTNNVFTLWLKHGVTPQNGNYAYVVVPNKNTAEEMSNYVAKNDITILSNTSQIQAVRHNNLNLHSFIFHSANQTFANDTISVNADKPCLLMVQPMANGKIRLHVSDPTKTQTQITIKTKWKGENIAREITIPLITGNVYGGQTAVGYLPEYSVLPLKLLNFNGKRGTNGVNLSWKSTNEKNVDYIEIWRKEKLGNAKSIIKVKPYNNESSTNNYSYTDRTATNDEQYYQLKIVDLDGTFSTSDFVVVPKMVKADDVLVFPNPANNYIYIKLEQKQLIRIYNSLGKLCQQTFVNEQDAVDISKLPNGIYYLRTAGKSTKFIVNR
ncbi:Chondroitinase-AC precursor [compost metagenome]